MRRACGGVWCTDGALWRLIQVDELRQMSDTKNIPSEPQWRVYDPEGVEALPEN